MYKKHLLLCTLILCVVSLKVFSQPPPPQPLDQNAPPGKAYAARLYIHHLFCNKITEGVFGRLNTNDELYMMVAARRTDGKTWTGRLPEGSTWSITDRGGGAEQTLTDRTGGILVWEGDLLVGESVEISCVFAEEDATSAAQKLAAVQRILNLVKNDDPKIGAAAEASGRLATYFKNDQDDYLGEVSMKITNDGSGTFKYQWGLGTNTIDKGEGENGWGKRFDLYGGGSGYNYFTYFKFGVIPGLEVTRTAPQKKPVRKTKKKPRRH